MKKRIKVLPLIIAALILAAIISIIIYIVKVTRDEYSLTINEKRWIESNKNVVVDISIMNDLPIFADEGNGILFSFLDYFSLQTGLEFNKKSYSITSDIVVSDYIFKIMDESEQITKNDLLFYSDHFVIISKNNEKINNINDILSYKIGVLSSDLDNINNYIQTDSDLSFISYDSISTMLSKFSSNDIDYIVVPKNQFLKVIIENNYYISYQFSGLSNKYVLSYNANNKELNSIFYKLYYKWYEENYDNLYVENMNDLYFELSEITEKEKAAFNSRIYIYGYVENLPYDYSRNGKLYGINSEFLKGFEAFSNTQFEYKKYSSVKELQEAIDDGIVDVAFNYYSFDSLKGVNYTIPVYSGNYVVLSYINNNITIDSFSSLQGQEIYMLKDTLLADYINTNSGATVKAYSKLRNLTRNKEPLIIVDLNVYNYYKNTRLKDYYVVYENESDINYNFLVKSDTTNDVFIKVFQFYLTNTNHNELTNKGMYDLTSLKSVVNISYIYYLLIIVVVVIIAIIVNKKRKLIRNKKEEKIRYIDALTSIKNRTYLIDNMAKWDLNKTYPKAIIIVDLNKLKEVNNNHGYDEGDMLIKKAANVLISTQLDNSDIIRSDGNEFTIYMVGYQENQVVQYIRKVFKLMQDLPYEYGATLGYSIIKDDVKTIEDAINEAILDMITNKELKANE